MKQTVLKMKKILAVLMCIFMLSSFAVPFVGAEDAEKAAIEWVLSKEESTLIVPKDGEANNVKTLPEPTYSGEEKITYSLCRDSKGEEVFSNVNITCNANKPIITVANGAKEFVAASGQGELTVYIKATAGENSKVLPLNIENFKVSVTFLNSDLEEELKKDEVIYGASAKSIADGIKDKVTVTSPNKYFHYTYEWVVNSGEEGTALDSVKGDTVFAPQINSVSHTFVKDDEKSTAATCTEDGLTVSKCSVCGYEKKEVVKGEHKWINVVDVPATCTEAGLKTAECSVCHKKLNETIDPLGHEWVVISPKVYPTCTEAGHEAKEKCARDGCAASRGGEEIKALGHNYVNISEKKATCTEAGYTAGVKCSYCGDIKEGLETVETTGHKMDKKVEAKNPTCTEDGNTAGTVCSVCGYSETVKTIPKLGHDIVVDKEGKEATCTEAGWSKAEHCTRCDYKAESTEIPAKGHTEEIIPAVAATCEKAGMSEGKRCSVCGTVTVEPTQSEEALGHDWVVDSIAVPATCTEKGKTEGKHCQREGCGLVVEPEETALLDHEYVIAEGKKDIEPTCTEDGLTAERVCANCGASVEEKVIPALGHVDKDNDNKCDRCGTEITHVDPSQNCSCICHSTGIKAFFWKILRAIIKFLGVEQVCKCGALHYNK